MEHSVIEGPTPVSRIRQLREPVDEALNHAGDHHHLRIRTAGDQSTNSFRPSSSMSSNESNKVLIDSPSWVNPRAWRKLRM